MSLKDFATQLIAPEVKRTSGTGRSLVGLVIEALNDCSVELKCTRHPLGFIHLDLTNACELHGGSFARLHVWDSELSPPDEAGNIHDHSWHLTSHILLGSLRDRNYLPRQTPDGEYMGSRVRYGTENSFVVAGRYELDLIKDETYPAGTIYRIPSRMVHESEPLVSPSMTFVVGVPDEKAAEDGPLILSKSESQPLGTPRRPEVDRREAIDILLPLLRLLP